MGRRGLFAAEDTTVGVVGLGNMGAPIAANLAGAGFALLVHDTRPEVVKAFVAERPGASAVEAAELAERCDVLVTLLPNGQIVRDVLEGLLDGGSGPLMSLADGGAVVDMSSSAPTGTVALGALLEGHGISMLDAPVSGGVARARTGSLSILVGGDPDLAERAAPVFGALGNAIHVGMLGAGHAVKALNNLLSAAGLVAAGEVLLVGKRFGVEPEVMLAALNASSGRNNSTENKFAQFVLSGTYASGFSLDLMVKDLRTAADLAESTGTPLTLGQLVTAMCAEARDEMPEGSDHTHVVEWLSRRAGTSLGET